MRRLNGEDGAVAVFVAILLTVVFGMGALVLDVGNMYWERRQLQTGAEAGALALAAECAEGLVNCATGSVSILGNVAQPYADLNSKDLRSAVPPVMNHGMDPASCEPGSGDAPNPLTDSNTVKVTTETIDAGNGESFLTHVLAPVLGMETATVTACAVATWGPIGGATTIPIALCERSWNYYTSSGTNLPSGPPAHVLRFTQSQENGQPVSADPNIDCTNPAGTSYAGGFAFLRRNSECMAVTREDDMAPGKTGNNPNDPTGSPDCDVDAMYSMFQDRIDNGERVLVPIFDYYEGSGSSGQYHIIGYGAFVFEGYSINGGSGDKEYGMAPNECTGGSASCLKGYFTEFITLDALPSLGGSGNYGATGVFLTG